MDHLLYLIFRCDGDVMESLDFGKVFGASKHTLYEPTQSLSLSVRDPLLTKQPPHALMLLRTEFIITEIEDGQELSLVSNAGWWTSGHGCRGRFNSSNSVDSYFLRNKNYSR